MTPNLEITPNPEMIPESEMTPNFDQYICNTNELYGEDYLEATLEMIQNWDAELYPIDLSWKGTKPHGAEVLEWLPSGCFYEASKHGPEDHWGWVAHGLNYIKFLTGDTPLNTIVSWDALMQYDRFKEAVERLIKNERLFSATAKARLFRVLDNCDAFEANAGKWLFVGSYGVEAHKTFQDPEGWTHFDFTAPEFNAKGIRGLALYYFQMDVVHADIDEGLYEASSGKRTHDGLQAALNTRYHIFTLPKGRARRHPVTGLRQVIVDDVAVILASPFYCDSHENFGWWWGHGPEILYITSHDNMPEDNNVGSNHISGDLLMSAQEDGNDVGLPWTVSHGGMIKNFTPRYLTEFNLLHKPGSGGTQTLNQRFTEFPGFNFDAKDDLLNTFMFRYYLIPQESIVANLHYAAYGEHALASDRDKWGWALLAQNMLKWHESYLTGKTPDETYVKWGWLTRYARFNSAVDEIMADSHLFSVKAKKELCKLLENAGAFTGGGKTIDFTNKATTYSDLKPNHFQYIAKGGSYSNLANVDETQRPRVVPDGLMAAIGSVSLYALPKVRTERMPNGDFTVTVEAIKLLLNDGFDFEGDDQSLGRWEIDGFPFPPYPKFDITGLPISNNTFNNFAAKYGKRHGFRTVSLSGNKLTAPKAFTYSNGLLN